MPTVLRWKFWGTRPHDGRQGTIADARPESVGQTIEEAWAWFDRTFAGAGYTKVTATAITAEGRLKFTREAVTA